MIFFLKDKVIITTDDFKMQQVLTKVLKSSAKVAILLDVFRCVQLLNLDCNARFD